MSRIGLKCRKCGWEGEISDIMAPCPVCCTDRRAERIEMERNAELLTAFVVWWAAHNPHRAITGSMADLLDTPVVADAIIAFLRDRAKAKKRGELNARSE